MKDMPPAYMIEELERLKLEEEERRRAEEMQRPRVHIYDIENYPPNVREKLGQK